MSAEMFLKKAKEKLDRASGKTSTIEVRPGVSIDDMRTTSTRKVDPEEAIKKTGNR